MTSNFVGLNLSEAELFRIIAGYSYDWEDWLGPDGRYLYVSPSFGRITGHPAADLMGDARAILEIVHPADRESFESHQKEVVSGARQECEPVSEAPLEFRIVRPDGSLRWISHHCRAILGQDGAWLGQRSTNQDISHLKQTEVELRESLRTVQALLNAPPDLALLIDPDGTIRMVNDNMAKIMRRPAEELVGQCLWNMFPPSIAEFRRKVTEEAIRTRQTQRVEDVRDIGIFDSTVTPILNDQGQVVQIAVLSRDITVRKQTEDALRSIVSNAPILLYFLDSAGKITHISGKALASIGINPAEVLGRRLSELTFATRSTQECIQRALAGEEFSQVVEFPQGLILEMHYTPVKNAQGEVTGVIGFGLDISESHRTRQALEKAHAELEKRIAERTAELEQANRELVAEAQLRRQTDLELRQERDFITSLINTARVILVVIDIFGRITRINSYLEELSGYTSEEVQGLDWFETFLPERDRARIRARFLQALTEVRVRGTINPIRSKNGREHEIEWFTSFIRDGEGEITGLLTIGHDVTERLEAERRVRQNAVRAEALARVAARLNAELDLRAVLEIVGEETVRTVNYPLATVMLYDEQTDTFQVAAAAGVQSGLAYQIENLPLQVFEEWWEKTGEYILIPDAHLINKSFNARLREKMDVRTIVSVPILHHGELIGCLSVVSIGEVYLPNEEELELLRALADQATTAIANARLFKEVSDAEQGLKILSQRLVEIQETERRALARELHDEIGQLLTSLNLNLEIIARSLGREAVSFSANESAGQLQAEVERARQLSQQLLAKVREISLDLRPALLDDLGLLPALLALFERYTSQTCIQVKFKHEGLNRRYPPRLETAAFRIIQEALTNVARHTNVQEATVMLWADEAALRLQVVDQGPGFDLQSAFQSSVASGLSGMRERAASCGGQLEIETEPGAGARLSAEFPLVSDLV